MRSADDPPAAHPDLIDTPSANALSARRVDSSAIFAGDREVVITHRGQEYRLRITKADKLLLTK